MRDWYAYAAGVVRADSACSLDVRSRAAIATFTRLSIDAKRSGARIVIVRVERTSRETCILASASALADIRVGSGPSAKLSEGAAFTRAFDETIRPRLPLPRGSRAEM